MVYLPDSSVATGTAVVICPGGAFNFLPIELEGTEVARWLCAHGIAAFVLKYRVAQTAARDEDLIKQLQERFTNLMGLMELMQETEPLAVGTSLPLYSEWKDADHPVELHLYAQGGHGFGMKKQGLPSDHWIDRFGDWLQSQGFLTRKSMEGILI